MSAIKPEAAPSAQTLTLSNGVVTMTSREIAELTGKDHFHVLRDVRTMLAELDVDASSLGGIYLDAAGREQPEFKLGEELTLTLLTGYSTVLRHKVVCRMKELETALKVARTGRLDDAQADTVKQAFSAFSLPDTQRLEIMTNMYFGRLSFGEAVRKLRDDSRALEAPTPAPKATTAERWVSDRIVYVTAKDSVKNCLKAFKVNYTFGNFLIQLERKGFIVRNRKNPEQFLITSDGEDYMEMSGPFPAVIVRHFPGTCAAGGRAMPRHAPWLD